MLLPHPIPYQGSKRSLACHILDCIPQNTTRLVEPFAGSAAISLAIASHNKAKSFWLNDLNEPLANLLALIINHPESISRAYRTMWEEQDGQEQTYYNQIREQFNKTQNPKYLLYLLARCVKAAIRYNSAGGFNQSPDNRRKGARPLTMRNHIMGASALLSGRTLITSRDFRGVLQEVTSDDVVYMDPPYQGVCSNRDSRYIGSLTYEHFVASLELLGARGVSYIVSYDGRTGTKEFGRALPASLGLTHVEIKAGKSSQATLLGRNEDTFESLYLSDSLVKRLGRIDFRERQPLLSIFSSDESNAPTGIFRTISDGYK